MLFFVCLHGALHHFINQLGILQSCFCPQIEGQAAGDGVDFGDIIPVAVAVQHIVDAHNALAIHIRENAAGQLLQIFGQLIADGGRHNALETGHALAAGTGQVFFREIQERRAGVGHFQHAGLHIPVIAQHGAVHFDGHIQPFFHQHPPVIGEGQFQCVFQFLAV